MSRKFRIPVRALGSEAGDPSISSLAAWIGAHRGTEADLITYKLEQSIQVQEGVDVPSAGGRFYLPRIQASLNGIENHHLTREPFVETRDCVQDADRILSFRKGAWCCLPAPRLWGLIDHYFHDPDEFLAALCHCTRQLMRAMRDRGIKGHILLCDRYSEEEVAELANRKVLIYAEQATREGLSWILERQGNIAVNGDQIGLALELLDEYDIARLTIVDPSEETLRRVQSHFDPDSVEAGGYCREECKTYWRTIINSAFIIQ
jgi:hypothetical protein